MNRSRKTGALHTPGAVRPGRGVRGRNRADAHSSFASGATTEAQAECIGGGAVQSPENDKAVSRPSHSGGSRSVRAGGGHGNGATMQGSENDEAVSRPSHSRLQNAGGAWRFAHSHAHRRLRLCVFSFRVKNKVKVKGVRTAGMPRECESAEPGTVRPLSSLSHGEVFRPRGGSCCARG